jgi:hypothetical protein
MSITLQRSKRDTALELKTTGIKLGPGVYEPKIDFKEIREK